MSHSPYQNLNLMSEQTLQELQAVLSDAQVSALLDDCVCEVRVRLTQIKDQLHQLESEARDEVFAAARRTAHDLKGVSGNFGLIALSEVAAELQKAAAGQTYAQVIDLGKDVLNIGELSLACLAEKQEEVFR